LLRQLGVTMSLLYELERDYGERRVNELLKENNLYGAVFICLNYPVPLESMISTLKSCSPQLIKVIGKDGDQINLGALSKNMAKKLIKIINEYKDVGKPYTAIIERKKSKTI